MIFQSFIYHSSPKKTTFVTTNKLFYMTAERPITLQEYAMRFGTYMGLFWIFKFIFLPIGFSIPLLQLLFILMTLFVPVLGYIYTRRYRNQYREGSLSFTQAFSFCFLMYLFASILAALAHYVYFRFIDQGYLLNTYLSQLDNIKDSVSGNMKISVEQLISSFEVISSLTPLQLTFQLLSQNFFYGILLSVPTALLTMKKKN